MLKITGALVMYKKTLQGTFNKILHSCDSGAEIVLNYC